MSRYPPKQRLEQARMKSQPPVGMPDKLELKLFEWNDIVSDYSKCLNLCAREEIEFLSSHSQNLAEYLKLHPTEAHELMSPSGFTDRIVRRYQRYLSGSEPVSTQNGDADKARWMRECFDTLLPGKVKVVANPANEEAPTWHELNSFICKEATCTLDAEIMAPEYEDKETGERVRVVKYGKKMQIEVTAKQWYLIWEHIVCAFGSPQYNPDVVEFNTLHIALKEIQSLPVKLQEWQWPIGQEIAIVVKQLEHRLRTQHAHRPLISNADCCPFRPTGTTNQVLDQQNLKPFLSCEEAASIVCEERIAAGESTFGVNYDPIVRQELEKRGVKCLPEGANCCFYKEDEEEEMSWESDDDDE